MQQPWQRLTPDCAPPGCDPRYGLFATTEGSGLAYPSAVAGRMPGGLGMLEFVGAMVSKALFEGILLNLALAPFFVTKLQVGTGRTLLFVSAGAWGAAKEGRGGAAG